MPNFEKFVRGSTAIVDDPAMTIQQRGVFSFNRAAWEALGQPAALELFFDREAQIIGLQATTTDNPNHYTFRRQQNSASYVVAGTAFCSFYGIELGNTRRYRAAWNDDLKMLTVDLKTEYQIVTSGRAAGARKRLEAQRARDLETAGDGTR